MACTSCFAFETWELADGRVFEANVKQVMPGKVLFILRTGADQSLEVTKLSESSRKRLVEVLGLGSSAAIVTPSAAVVPTPPSTTALAMQPVPVVPLATVTRDPAAMDATDSGSLEANFGLTVVVIGKVKNVSTLGSSGHKLLEFEDSEFHVFVNKRQAELPGWNFESLLGKTVQVKGKIAKYNEKLQVQLYEPTQLGAVE